MLAAVVSSNATIAKLEGYDLRGDNAFRYDSPNVSGFVGSFAYALNEKAQSVCPQCNGNNGAVVSASLVYAAGPISGVLAYQQEKPYQPAGVGAAGTDYAGTDATDRSFLRLSGQYDFGTIIAKAGFGRADHVNFIQAARTNEFQIGADYKLTGALTLSGGFANSKDAATATTLDVKRSAFTLGGKYVMSKRTFLYGGYEAGEQKISGAPTAKESILAIGMQHRF